MMHPATSIHEGGLHRFFGSGDVAAVDDELWKEK